MAGGEKVFDFELTQLHIKLDNEAFYNLALAYGRISFLGKECIDEAVLNNANLRARILEVLQVQFGSRERRRAEMNIVEQVGQKTSSFFDDIQEAADFIEQQSTISVSLRQRAGRIRQLINENEMLLLKEEREQGCALGDLLKTPLASLAEALTAQNPVEKHTKINLFLASASDVSAQCDKGGVFAHTVCLPIIQHLCSLASREADIAAIALVPKVTLRQSTKKYPIDQTGETIRLHVELVNEGGGSAEQCAITFIAPSDAQYSFLCAMPIYVNPIPAGRYSTLECPLRLNSSFDSLKISVNICYKDIFGRPYQFNSAVIVECQAREVDWDELLLSSPYSLTPVSSPERLRGRSNVLNRLKLNVAAGNSTVIWGQKRVGKTSIAQIFCALNAQSKNDISIYVRRGSVAGFSEGQIARHIASQIADAAPEFKLVLPDEAWFGPYLTRLSDWVERARNSGLNKTIIIVLDEFDEWNSALYLGQRGDNFFATIRSLSEKQIRWVFVGGERMPDIFHRHHSTLNQVDVFKIDRVTDPKDVEDIIVGPVQAKLDWDAEAVEFVRQITAGNPYYIHMVCSRVLKDMYSARRTFIDRADVVAAAQSITSESTPTHWGHFWEDNSDVDLDRREKRAALSAALLTAFGISQHKYGTPVPLASLQESAELIGIEKSIVDPVLDMRIDLVQRDVLEEKELNGDTRYQVTVPIFGDFLSAHGRVVVYPFYKQYTDKEAAESQFPSGRITPSIISIQESPFPIEEEELISISDGLVYQGIPVDAIRIKAWLKQFPDESAIILASKLLRRLRERYYFDLSHVRRAVDDAYKWLQEEMQRSGHKALIVAGSRIVNVHIAYLGIPSKSGADTAREFKTQKRFSRCASINDALRWIKNDSTLKPEEKYILVVDDFIGTGNQSKTELLTVANRIRQDEMLMQWAKTGKLLFTPLWAYAEGVDNVRGEIGDIVHIQPARNLDDEDRAFSPSCPIWESPDERGYAENVFMHIGQQLESDEPLGFGGCQSLVVFENTVPNDTLTAIWKTGIVNERQWNPLFMRP